MKKNIVFIYGVIFLASFFLTIRPTVALTVDQAEEAKKAACRTYCMHVEGKTARECLNVTVTPACYRTSGVTPVNGVCGSANGTTISVVPATGLCSIGAASAVTGTGPWNWSCLGTGGGSDDACLASFIPAITPRCGSYYLVGLDMTSAHLGHMMCGSISAGTGIPFLVKSTTGVVTDYLDIARLWFTIETLPRVPTDGEWHLVFTGTHPGVTLKHYLKATCDSATCYVSLRTDTDNSGSGWGANSGSVTIRRPGTY